MTSMDPFEEFEFKPITDGLGFHKKKNAQNQTTPQASLRGIQATVSQSQAGLQSPLNNKPLHASQPASQSHQGPELHVPLPRKEDTLVPTRGGGIKSSREIASDVSRDIQRSPERSPEKSPNPSIRRTPNADEVLANIKQKKFDFTEKLQSPSPVKLDYVSTSTHFTACFLDGMLIISLNLMALVGLLMTTKIDFAANLIDPDRDGVLYLAMLMLFCGMSFIYLVVMRMFLGFTPGEWVFDQRIGRPEQFGRSSYYFKLLLRSFLVLATGGILFPLLSKIYSKDVLGRWLGVELIRRAS